MDLNHLNFRVRDAAACRDFYERQLHAALHEDGIRTTELEDHRSGEDDVTFRCWDPDGTEIEVFWEQPS